VPYPCSMNRAGSVQSSRAPHLTAIRTDSKQSRNSAKRNNPLSTLDEGPSPVPDSNNDIPRVTAGGHALPEWTEDPKSMTDRPPTALTAAIATSPAVSAAGSIASPVATKFHPKEQLKTNPSSPSVIPYNKSAFHPQNAAQDNESSSGCSTDLSPKASSLGAVGSAGQGSSVNGRPTSPLQQGGTYYVASNPTFQDQDSQAGGDGQTATGSVGADSRQGLGSSSWNQVKSFVSAFVGFVLRAPPRIARTHPRPRPTGNVLRKEQHKKVKCISASPCHKGPH
jgi:hypothetical protein